jgi:hypothetical protein
MAANGDNHIDIVSTPEGEFVVNGSDSEGTAPRPWVGIQFECCGVYARVYRAPEAKFYESRCPRCGLPVKLRVGPDGVSTRFFRAGPA